MVAIAPMPDDVMNAGLGRPRGRAIIVGGDVHRGVAEAAVPDLVQPAGLDVLVGLVVEEVRHRVVDRRDDGPRSRRVAGGPRPATLRH